MRSYLEEVIQRQQDPRYTRYMLVLFEQDAIRMDREQLGMIYDGLWLIQQGLKGHTEGPLSTPRLRLPVRNG